MIKKEKITQRIKKKKFNKKRKRGKNRFVNLEQTYFIF